MTTINITAELLFCKNLEITELPSEFLFSKVADAMVWEPQGSAPG